MKLLPEPESKKRIFFLALLLLIASAFLPIPQSLLEWDRVRREELLPCHEVLFVGNSLTSVNDIPGIVSQLSRTLPDYDRICPYRDTPPGVTLQWHWEQGGLPARLAERKWDFVVLQEQSVRSFNQPEEMERWIRLIIEEVKKSGAVPILYMISSRSWSESAQTALDQRMIQIAESTHTRIVPVNQVWRKLYADNPNFRIYESDGHHPGPYGAYVAAALFIHTITREWPHRWPESISLPPILIKDLLIQPRLSLTREEVAGITNLTDERH